MNFWLKLYHYFGHILQSFHFSHVSFPEWSHFSSDSPIFLQLNSLFSVGNESFIS